jgi:predicted alpha/beta hydrolase
MDFAEKIDVQSGDGSVSGITVYPVADPGAAVIICMPAMGVSARHYGSLAEALARLGWNVITADLRGNGQSRIRAGRGCDFGYQDMVIYDWPAVVAKAASLFPHSSRILFGHSLGGQLSALYMARAPGEISGLILVSAPSVYYRGWPLPLSLGLLFLSQMSRLIAQVLGYFPGRRLGFGGTEARTVVKDWAYAVRTGQYAPKNADCNYEELMHAIIAPVLAISFCDDRFSPKKAVDNFCSKMSAADITRWHLAPGQIGRKAMGHMGLLRPPELLVEIISDWLTAKAVR